MSICEIRGLTRAFKGNEVLRGTDLDLPAGEVAVLMGANGAGRSTLVKVLRGVHGSDGGSVTRDGAAFAPASPAEAMRAGVATVHQSIDEGVIPDLDVASNLLLDRLAEPGAATWLNGRRMRRDARAIAASTDLEGRARPATLASRTASSSPSPAR